MLHRSQQLGIDSRQPRQRSRSRRSSLRLLLVIKGSVWACPTISSCPSAVNNRLTQGECVPVSIAMRHRGMLPNTCFMASGVVASLCSKTISPASFKTQYELERSPRSNPMVSCPFKMVSPFVCIVLIFCIAGLLFVLQARPTLGAYRIPRETGLLIPSPLRDADAANQVLEALILVQAVEYRFDFEVDHEVVALLETLLQPFERALLIADAHTRHGRQPRRHVPRL